MTPSQHWHDLVQLIADEGIPDTTGTPRGYSYSSQPTCECRQGTPAQCFDVFRISEIGMDKKIETQVMRYCSGLSDVSVIKKQCEDGIKGLPSCKAAPYSMGPGYGDHPKPTGNSNSNCATGTPYKSGGCKSP